MEGHDMVLGVFTCFTLKLRDVRGEFGRHVGPRRVVPDGVIGEPS